MACLGGGHQFRGHHPLEAAKEDRAGLDRKPGALDLSSEVSPLGLTQQLSWCVVCGIVEFIYGVVHARLLAKMLR